MLVASYYSDRTVERKLFVSALFLLAGAIAFYISYLIGPSNFWLSFLLLVIAGGCMYAPYGPFFAIHRDLPRNVSGEATALINSMGALGSFVGVYVVGYLNGATGGNGAGFIFMAASLVVAVICTLAVRVPGTWLYSQLRQYLKWIKSVVVRKPCSTAGDLPREGLPAPRQGPALWTAIPGHAV